jgi:hypothetical protein
MKRSEPQVDVDVRAQPGTEIFLVDHRFRLRAQGVGQMKAAVEPGLYKIKYRAGSRIVETHEAISAGSGTAHFEAPDVPYFSAAPLSTARTTHETHEGAAQRISKGVTQHLGTGSEIFVFTRAWTESLGDRPRVPPVPKGHHPAQGLSLRHPNGSLAIDIEGQSEVSKAHERDPWAGIAVAIAPGAYRLRVETPRWGPLEQTVIASPGWQTQVFLLQDNFPSKDESVAYRPDLAGASVLLARIGRGFDPQKGELRLAELARQSLARGRVVLSGEQLGKLFAHKESSPMLGIYAAHALLARGQRHQIAGTVKELEALLGRHPDVQALRLALSSRPAASLHFSDPPMLAASWSIILNKASKHPQLVPGDTLASRVAPWLWGSGPWLIWQAEPVESTMVTATSASLEAALQNLASLGASKSADLSRFSISLNDNDAALLSAVVQGSPPPPPMLEPAMAAAPVQAAVEDELAAEAIDGSPASPAQLGASLRLPPSSLHAAVDDLSRKLSEM